MTAARNTGAIVAAKPAAIAAEAPDLLPLSPALMFEGLLRWLPTALLLVNPEGSVIHINERAATLLRVSDIAGDLRRLADFPSYLQPLSDIFATETSTDLIRQEVSLTFPAEGDAQSSQSRVIGYTLRHEQLPGVGAVRALVFSDITEILKEKAAAEQIKHELFQTKKMAAMGNLIAGVAHELNNPLIAIHMSADLSRRSVERLLDDAHRGLKHLTPADWLLTVESSLSRTLNEVERVQGATTQATALVSDLLDYSRPGRLELSQVDAVDFVEMLLSQWEATILAADATGQPVTVRVHRPEQIPMVSLDPVRMEQVLFHVVRNAVEASTVTRPCQLSVAFKVLYDEQDPQKSRLHLVVSDNGVGMSPELTERAFEPFFTTKGRHSTGLGLSQAFVTVERHGGQLSLTSQPGQGTQVTIALPYPEAEPPRHSSQTTQQDARR